ncbi:MAG: DNA repair protein RecO [Lautropia sp.]|nr:DNA repair protein RecO [Lautropia sp.]
MAMNDELGFVLHSHPYKETSLIVELFLRERGRISVVAKGARRPLSALRPVLLQFQPVLFRLAGRSELRTLTHAEWQGGLAVPAGRALLFGFYLNELLIRLVAREDPHPRLFDAYFEALESLGGQGADERILRRFEWLLLKEIGYAPDLSADHRGRPLDPARAYRLDDGLWVPVELPDNSCFSGQAIQHIAAGRYDQPGVLQQAKRLSRQVLGTPLEGASLNTRRILMDLQRL